MSSEQIRPASHLACVLLVALLAVGAVAGPALAVQSSPDDYPPTDPAPGETTPSVPEGTVQTAGEDDDPFPEQRPFVRPRSEHADDGQRDRVERTETYPYAAVVHVNLGDDRPGATGALVEPDVVVTAAHVAGAAADPEDVTVQPGRDGDDTPFGSVDAEAVHVDERYERDFPHDFALIELEEPIGAETGTFDVRSLEGDERDAIPNVTVTGYPHDRPAYTMWEHTETLHLEDGDPLRLTGDHETWIGNSGSPYWTVIDGEPTVIGVLTHGPIDSALLSNGTGIDDHRVEMIETVSDAPGSDAGELAVELRGTPSNVTAGETITVDAAVRNDGTVASQQTVTLSVGGAVVDETELYVEPGATTAVTLAYETDGDDVPGVTATVATETDSAAATVTVRPAPIALGNQTQPPRDLNGDGLYRDVTADGEVTTADVRVFQAALFTPAVQDRVAAYDFSESGDVSHGDVIALFREASGLPLRTDDPDASSTAAASSASSTAASAAVDDPAASTAGADTAVAT